MKRKSIFSSSPIKGFILLILFALLLIFIWTTASNPLPAKRLIKNHPYAFSEEKEWGEEQREIRVKNGSCFFISYPKTNCKETDDTIAAFVATAKEKCGGLPGKKRDGVPRLVIDYTAKNKKDYIALTLTYGAGRYNKENAGEDHFSGSQSLYLDSDGNILNLNTLLGEKNSKKLAYLLKKENRTMDDISSFSYDEEKVTLYWGDDQYTVSMAEIQKTRIIDPAKPMIALTFDDGPGFLTQKFVDLLNQYDGRGTFFMLGQNVGRYKESVKYAFDQGHEIASHTMRHKNLNVISPSEVKKEINDADQAIAKITGQRPALVRAPYGNSKPAVVSIINRPVIYWDKDTEDWKSRNAEAVKSMILNQVSDGSIILMHEIYQSTYDGLALALKELEKEGYQFVTVSELMKYRNVKPEAKVYYSFPKAK